MRRRAPLRALGSTLAFLWLMSACAPRSPRTLDARANGPRDLSTAARSTSLRLAGSLRRLVLKQPSIRVVLEADCAEMTGFLQARTLDARAAISGAPGETFRAKVSSVHKPDTRPGGSTMGTIALDVENPNGRILPGRVVAVSVGGGAHSQILVGVAQPGEAGGQLAARPTP
jgi:hypothetical protein